MPTADANGIRIEYETFGDPASTPLLLICGWSVQMIIWDEGLCNQLAESGHYVIRFDNRDTGLSTKFDEAGLPDLMAAFGAVMQGHKPDATYTMDDMAGDAIGLLDALGISKAHICGISMGGAITQNIGVRYPDRVLSLIPIYGPTGNPEIPMADPALWAQLLEPTPQDKEGFIEASIKRSKFIAGPGFIFDEDWHRQFFARSFDRNNSWEGIARQLVAALTQGNMKKALATIKAPTLIVQGTDDPLIRLENGKDMADGIPGAKLMLIEGMGHDFPNGRGAWPQIMNAMLEHMKEADAK
ncbi:MAG: alpha/beta fold hydrolase [Pseudomonadota bacterium]